MGYRNSGQFVSPDPAKFRFGEGWKDGEFDLKNIGYSCNARYTYLQVLGFTYAAYASSESMGQLGMNLIIDGDDDLRFLESRLARKDDYDWRKEPLNTEVDFYLRPRKDKERIQAVRDKEDSMPLARAKKDAFSRDRVRMRNPNFTYYRGMVLPELNPEERARLLEGLVPPCIEKTRFLTRNSDTCASFNTSNHSVYLNVGHLLSMDGIQFLSSYREIYRGAKKSKLCPIYSFLFTKPQKLEKYVLDDFRGARRTLESLPELSGDDIIGLVQHMDMRRFMQNARLEGRLTRTLREELALAKDEISREMRRMDAEMEDERGVIRKYEEKIARDRAGTVSDKKSLYKMVSKSNVRISKANGRIHELYAQRSQLEDYFESFISRADALPKPDEREVERKRRSRRGRSYDRHMMKELKSFE